MPSLRRFKMLFHEDLRLTNAHVTAPHEIERTGDDRPAATLRSYIWRMSGRHQLGAGLIAILSAGLSLLPIELQRRIVDDAIMPGDVEWLLWLGGAYLAALVAAQIAKLSLALYQSWIGESAVAYTRSHLLEIHRRHEKGEDGTAISIIGAEADKLGSFVGNGPSQAASSIALLLGAVAYMLAVEPGIAALGIALILPQIVLTPLLQRRLNRLVAIRLRLMRRLGDRIPEAGAKTPGEILALYHNRMLFYFWKFALKALLNLLNGLAPLGVLVWGGWLVIQGDTTLGVLVAFLSALERIAGPVRQLISLYREAAQAEVQHAAIAKWM